MSYRLIVVEWTHDEQEEVGEEEEGSDVDDSDQGEDEQLGHCLYKLGEGGQFKSLKPSRDL